MLCLLTSYEILLLMAYESLLLSLPFAQGHRALGACAGLQHNPHMFLEIGLSNP